jgi:hypothetical protein
VHASFICNNGTVDEGFTALFTFAAEHFVVCVGNKKETLGNEKGC